MANHRLFLVFCLASILYSIDCTSLGKQSNEGTPITKASSDSVPSIVPAIAPNSTSVAPPTNGTTTPPSPPSPPPPPPPPTTTTPNSTTTAKPTPSTTLTPTTPKPSPSPTTTSPPSTTTAPPSKHDRSFDVPSFIGGVILSLGLAAIGYVVYKFYRTRTDPNYRSL